MIPKSWLPWIDRALELIGDREVSGAELLAEINQGLGFWSRWSTSSFYKLMRHMEDQGLLMAWFEWVESGGQITKRRMFKSWMRSFRS